MILKLFLSFNKCFVYNSYTLIAFQFLPKKVFKLWTEPLLLELMETLEHDVLWMQILNSHHVQEHVVAEVETRIQWITLSLENSLGIFWLQLLVSHEDGNTTVILTSTACSS